MNEAITITPAGTDDAAAISSVLAANGSDPGLFQESATAVAHTLGDFLVAHSAAGEIVGCAGLHRDSPEEAEVYAVAVTPHCQGQGIGRQLMQACQQRARVGGLHRLWLATVKPSYFSRYGFQPISRWQLPASALLRKLRQTFQQPSGRWLPALFGRHTFMVKTLGAIPTSTSEQMQKANSAGNSLFTIS
jgi:amino-acid N-acetyltransferase